MDDDRNEVLDLQKNALAGRLSRREVLRRGIALGLTAPAIASLLAACGEDGDDASGEDEEDTTGEDEDSAGEDEDSAGEDEDGDGEGEESGELGEIVPTLELAHYSGDQSPVYPVMARILQEDFGQLGFDIELRPINFNTFVSEISVGGQIVDLAQVNWGGDPDRLDPNHWVVDLNTCDAARNAGHWCDEDYDEMADEQSQSLDEDARREILQELQVYHNEQLPQWYLSQTASWMLWNHERFEEFPNPTPNQSADSKRIPWLAITPLTDETVLRWGHNEDVSTWNILAETASFGWLRMVYQTFVSVEADGPQPWAATEWETVDDTTIEVTMREGATFHDGEPVTAEDAAFTYNYLLEWRPPTFEVAVENVESAEVVDEYTFRINLAEPDASFVIKSLGFVPVLPQHIWSTVPDDTDVSEPIDWDPRPDNVIGSGPFVFEHWNQDEEHFLSTFEDFFEPPNISGIRRVVIGSADALSAALAGGDVDFANGVLDPAGADQLANDNAHLTFELIPTHGTRTFCMNHEKELFQDLAVRKALRMATNKERINTEADLGYGTIAGDGPVPQPLEAWYNEDLEAWPYDLDEARRVLEEAGYGWDDDGRIHFPANGSSS